jgi:glucose-1-phosphate cytidylyltransferase
LLISASITLLSADCSRAEGRFALTHYSAHAMTLNSNSAIPVVILCGGRGLRMGDRSVPKPLAQIGGRVVLWHVMALYGGQGFRSFVLCLGHQGQRIRSDVESFEEVAAGEWDVRFVDTGDDTPTGGRVARVGDLVSAGTFCLTYADGLADLDLAELLRFHAAHGRAATVTVVQPENPWGVAALEPDDTVASFTEKPQLDCWVNGGFFVMEPETLSYIGLDDVLERTSMEALTRDRELVAYRHDGFWECMDTYKDALRLNDLWEQGAAPWRERVPA